MSCQSRKFLGQIESKAMLEQAQADVDLVSTPSVFCISK
jgi:hypothetical protein